MIQLAAATFEVHARPGSAGRTLVGNTASHVFMPLKSSVFIIVDGERMLALLTSHWMCHHYKFSNLARNRVAQALGIPMSQVVLFSSHNHCVVALNEKQYHHGHFNPDEIIPESDLTVEGAELMHGFIDNAVALSKKLQPVTVHYARGSERRITHNRKGRRGDGSTYLMREEDRLLLGEDFCGDIDDDAFVIAFHDNNNKPIAMLTQFTGHPVTAFHCDAPVVHGEFPQIACDDLSAAYGDIPVGFLQGCAGDTNSKGLLAATPAEENAARATRYGHLLGETFIRIAKERQPSQAADMQFAWLPVTLPFAAVPPRAELEARLAAAEDFIRRCDAGETDSTRGCDGLNFPTNMTVPYRKALIEPIRKWLNWALDFHRNNCLHKAPTHIESPVFAARIGDVGIVGMQCEPLLGIGRQIKATAPTAVTLPCGYMNDTSVAYIPDAPNNGDFDYSSAFYRYTTTLLPYRQPAGDLLASAATELLTEMTP